MRKLVITQNITLDGSIEMLDDWFDPQRQDEDLLAESHRQDSQADALLVGRQTFEDFRGYWPKQTDDSTGGGRRLFPDGVLDRSADSGATAEGVRVWRHVAALCHVNARDRTTAVVWAVRLAMWQTSSIRRPRNGIGIAMRRKRNGWTAIGRACYRNCG
ncbi:hypothetical protein Mycsm_03677 [Mycobacterium sp. JS623]|nr:hypothetical protein Mycsm_03677 [Mycobacterium sp. JS623]